MSYASITLKDISYKKKKRNILSVESLSVNSEKVTGIIGPNGAGKSTLIKIMALLEKPDTGKIFINGNQVWPGTFKIKERRKLAFVFQQPLMLDTTVYKNVGIGLNYRRLPRADRKIRIDHWLERFNIQHLAMQNANRLSGGEAQRVALARAFVTEPEVLFLDEPFSALDLPTKKKLLRDFKHILKETKTTTLFISHDYDEIKYMCDSIVILSNGQIYAKGGLEILGDETLPLALRNFLSEWTSPLSNET